MAAVVEAKRTSNMEQGQEPIQQQQQQEQAAGDIPLDSDRQGWGESWASKGDEDKMQRYELMGDVRAQDDSMAMSEVIEGLDSGNPLALEQFNLGTSSTGEPIATFRDQFGNMQHIKISTAQWLGVRDQRNNNRKQMAAWEMQQKELAEDKEELYGSFRNSIENIDDELFVDYLRNKFDEDPRAATAELINYRRVEAQDQELAEQQKQQLLEAQWAADSERAYSNYENGIVAYEDSTETNYQNAILSEEGDVAQHQLQRQWAQRRASAMRKAGTHRPVMGMHGVPVSQAYTGQVLGTVIRDWLSLLQEGTPTANGAVAPFTIPHPSDPDFLLKLDEVIPALNGIAGSLGWRNGFTELDKGEIVKAINTHYNVHGEQVRIQELERQVEALERAKEETKGTPMAGAYSKEIDATRAQVEDIRSVDLNNNGQIDPWEVADEGEVRSGEAKRSERRDVRSAMFGKSVKQAREARAESKEELQGDLDRAYKRKINTEKQIDEAKKHTAMQTRKDQTTGKQVPYDPVAYEEKAREIEDLESKLEREEKEWQELASESGRVAESELKLVVSQMTPEQKQRWVDIIEGDDDSTFNKVAEGTIYESDRDAFLKDLESKKNQNETIKLLMKLVEAQTK